MMLEYVFYFYTLLDTRETHKYVFVELKRNLKHMFCVPFSCQLCIGNKKNILVAFI